LLLFLFQLLLAIALTAFPPAGSHMRPRRFLMLDFSAVALIASLMRETMEAAGTRRILRHLVVAALVVGNVWQLAQLKAFADTPIRRADGFGFTLPYTHSAGDYTVRFASVDLFEELAERVEGGEQLLLVYGYGAHDEDVANPEAVLPRLYLRLGHQRFVESVFVFSTHSCQHECLPIRPIDSLEPFLDDLRAAGSERLRTITGYVAGEQPHDQPFFRDERARALVALSARFTVRYASPPEARVRRFTLEAS
jgi:hypothetical protein